MKNKIIYRKPQLIEFTSWYSQVTGDSGHGDCEVGEESPPCEGGVID